MPSLEDLILPAISCPIDIEKGTRGGIRLRMLKDLLEVEVRHANGDTSYGTDPVCSREHVFVNEPYYPYFGLVAANTDKIVNDIDISAIYVKNLDEREYQNKQELEALKLNYLIKKHQGGMALEEEGEQQELHAHDLLAARL